MTKSYIFKLLIIEILVLQQLSAHVMFLNNTSISKMNVLNICNQEVLELTHISLSGYLFYPRKAHLKQVPSFPNEKQGKSLNRIQDYIRRYSRAHESFHSKSEF